MFRGKNKKKLKIKIVICVVVIFFSYINNVLACTEFYNISNTENAGSEDEQVKNNLIEYMDALHKYKNFHGSVLVKKSGKTLLDCSYGMSDYENEVSNKQETKIPIASITKQFTAVAIMKLYEDGLICLDDKISKYIPDFNRGKDISIHNLLTHTSGIARNYVLTSNKIFSSTYEAIYSFKDMKLEFEPGEKFKYSNLGYVVLGYIIEKVSGVPYEEYVRKNIFEPLNMNDTGKCFREDKPYFDSKGYAGFLELLPMDIECEKITSNYLAACDFYSTIEDMDKWESALFSGKILNLHALNIIFEPHIDISSRIGAYGYGWFVKNSPYGKEVFHDGGSLGHTSIISKYIDKSVTIIVLTNHAFFKVLDLKNNLAAIIFGDKYELPKELKELKVELKVYDNIVGTYKTLENIMLKIVRRDEVLYIVINEVQEIRIFAESEDCFFSKIRDAKFIFMKDELGNVGNMLIKQYVQEDLIAKKQKDM